MFRTGIRVAAIWNLKARQWNRGRKKFPVIPFNEKVIWMHCASLGEFEQGRPVLEETRKNYPGYTIVLSFFSPSGYEIRKNYTGADTVIYLPIDNIINAKKLIAAINPSLVIWVKYEYWYYYLTELKKRNIPIILVSGIFRDSQPFFKWYGAIWQEMLHCFRQLFVQNELSAHLVKKIGLDKNVSIGGDTRFDRVVAIAEKGQPVNFIQEFVQGRQVFVAGSTWEDDEIELIHYVKAHPEIKFIIAPHEVDQENLEDVKKEFHNSIFYSELETGIIVPGNINVLIIDNIGMLSKLYQYADITYVGGGFNKDGIHNILEAAVYGKPVFFGPVYDKFAEACDLLDRGGAFTINNALELEDMLDKLFNDKAALIKAGMIAGEYVYSKRGATKKVMDYVTENRLLTN